MDEMRDSLREEFQEPEARRDYAEMFLDSSIALQIKALRQQRGWTQQELAARAGLKQSQVSAMEQASFSSWTLRTLRKLAKAFDLALTVRFESFGWLLDDALSSSREALERPSFAADPAFAGPGGQAGRRPGMGKKPGLGRQAPAEDDMAGVGVR